MLLILVALSVIASLLCHLLIKRFWVATIISTASAAGLFWLLAASHSGWFDRVFYRNLAIALTVSFAVAAGVGILLRSLKGGIRK
jgi:hypothetical protein